MTFMLIFEAILADKWFFRALRVKADLFNMLDMLSAIHFY